MFARAIWYTLSLLFSFFNEPNFVLYVTAHERGPQKEVHVNIEHFGDVLKWFPILHPSNVPMLDRICTLLRHR